jgi:hypothetical protein
MRLAWLRTPTGAGFSERSSMSKKSDKINLNKLFWEPVHPTRKTAADQQFE